MRTETPSDLLDAMRQGAVLTKEMTPDGPAFLLGSRRVSSATVSVLLKRRAIVGNRDSLFADDHQTYAVAHVPAPEPSTSIPFP